MLSDKEIAKIAEKVVKITEKVTRRRVSRSLQALQRNCEDR
jgi:hypothetical protein